MSEKLFDQRATWQEKPVLREIYEALYGEMARACHPGSTLEIGGGSGNFREFATGVVSTDIQRVSWLDVVCDAHRLPFAPSSFDNVVMFDVLHHLDRPRRFFSEAADVLREGGRIVMVEPMITPGSWPVYRFLHPEPVVMDADPLEPGEPATDKDPFDANQAIPALLFRAGGRALTRAFPSLRVLECRYRSLWAYPLSGGFRKWSLIPSSLVRPTLWLEDRLAPILGPLMAFRVLVVVEKHGTPAREPVSAS